MLKKLIEGYKKGKNSPQRISFFSISDYITNPSELDGLYRYIQKFEENYPKTRLGRLGFELGYLINRI